MDNNKQWASDAINYIDLVLNGGGPVSGMDRHYLINAKLLLRKITEAAP
jgi:hypothetical protein